MKYRAPRAKQWTEISLELAMEMVAERVWNSRKRTFVGSAPRRIRPEADKSTDRTSDPFRGNMLISAAPRSITKKII